MSDAGIEPRPARLAALFAGRAPVVVVLPPPPDLEAIRDVAFALGVTDGEATAAAALAPLRAALVAATAAFADARVVDVAALRAPFVHLLTRLAQAVVAAELRLAPDHIAALVDVALAAIVLDGEARLHLHPDDAARFVEAGLPVTVVADAELAAGTALVVEPHFVIADSFETRLAAVLEAGL